MLRSLQAAAESWDGGADGAGVKLMPSIWNEGSYPELERVLRLLRESDGHDRRLWFHVCWRYVWAHERLDRVPVVRTRKGPVPLPPPHAEVAVVLGVDGRKARVKLRVWPDIVDERLVAEGVARIAGLMYGGDAGRVQVPRELRDRVEAAASVQFVFHT